MAERFHLLYNTELQDGARLCMAEKWTDRGWKSYESLSGWGTCTCHCFEWTCSSMEFREEPQLWFSEADEVNHAVKENRVDYKCKVDVMNTKGKSCALIVCVILWILL